MISYDEKNKRYRVSVNFKDFDGKNHRKWFSCKTRKEAKELESREILKSKESLSSSAIPFKSAFDTFIEWKMKSKRKTTIDFYKSIFNHHILNFYKKANLSDITFNSLNRWKDSIRTDISLGRKQQIFICFHAFLKYCDMMFSTSLLPVLDRVGNFERDPNEVTIKEKKLHFWTPEEFSKISSAMRKEALAIDEVDRRFMIAWSCYVFLNILFYTGLRRGECNALKVSDFHDDGIRPYLDINKSITQKATDVDWLLTDPKNKNSVRIVPVPQNLALILREHIKNRLSRLGIDDISNLYLVGGVRPLSDNTFNTNKERFERKLEIPHIRTHDLRHSYASVLINNGVTPDVIQKLMGHSSIQITLQIYSHLYPKTLTSAVNIFDQLTTPLIQNFDYSK